MYCTLAQSKQTQTQAFPHQTAMDTAGVFKLVVVWYLKQPVFEPEGEEEVGVDDLMTTTESVAGHHQARSAG